MLVPAQLARLVKRGRIKPRNPVILEPKYDGVLLVVDRGRLYTILGRPAPPSLRAAAWLAGAAGKAIEMSRDGFVVFIEVYGRRLTPHGYHRRHNRDYDAVVVEVGFRGLDGRVKMLPPEKAADAAELYGLRYVEYRYEEASVIAEPPESMAEALPLYRGWEGYVAKLYAAHGHNLPPEYGAKLAGLLAVKARWESLGRLLA